MGVLNKWYYQSSLAYYSHATGSFAPLETGVLTTLVSAASPLPLAVFLLLSVLIESRAFGVHSHEFKLHVLLQTVIPTTQYTGMTTLPLEYSIVGRPSAIRSPRTIE